MPIVQKISKPCSVATTDLSYANLINTNFRSAILTNTDLAGANLALADFTGANLSSTSLISANLIGAKGVNVDINNESSPTFRRPPPYKIPLGLGSPKRLILSGTRIVAPLPLGVGNGGF